MNIRFSLWALTSCLALTTSAGCAAPVSSPPSQRTSGLVQPVVAGPADAAALGGTPTRAKVLRVYFVGNSVTDTINYDGLAALSKERGQTLVYGRQMIPGAPLEWLWGHPNDGFQVEGFGYPTKAFSSFAWDAISLQPFDRHLEDDVRDTKNFIQLALKNPANAQTQFIIYERWPRMSKGGKGVDYDKNNFGKDDNDPSKITDYSKLDAWQTLYGRTYTGGWDGSEESRDYFQKLVLAVRKANPELQKPVLLVPVGDVLLALDKKMIAGEVPGHRSIWDVYADGIHFNKIGSYIVGCTFYAMLWKQSPKGLSGAPYHMTDARLNALIQDTVWEVVSKHPLAGVAPAPKS